MLVKFWKVVKLVLRLIRTKLSTLSTRLLFRLNGIRCGKHLRAVGIPSVNVSLGGQAEIGDGFHVRTGLGATEIGSVGTRIRVGPSGVLKVGNRVGMSNATLFCANRMTIGDDVFIGGGVQVFDTDFHSTDPAVRASGYESPVSVKTAPVSIGNDVFIGANAIVCKGVSIGNSSIVAAGSVVAHDIPDREIWGGNPARKLK